MTNYYRGIERAARYISGQGLRLGTQFAARKAGSYVRTKLTSNPSGVQTTSQYDFKRQYKYKRAPARIRRRAKKAYRRFVKQSLKLVGTNTVVKNDSNVTVTSALIKQNYTAVHCGGTNGGGDFGGSDLNTILSSDTRINPSSGKVLLQNSSVDITMRNTSDAVTGAPLEVDVYEVAYWDSIKPNTFAALVTAVQTDTPAIGSLSSLLLTDRGTQLFDFPAFAKKGLKIYKKTKVFLPIGNTATYRMSLRKNMWINATNDIIDSTGYVKRGYTKSLIFVFKPVVGSSDTCSLAIGNTRKYVYKIFEDDADRDGLL